MLLDESRWRIDLIGDWSAPLVREETKWRYGLYRKWLQFLDEGLGDSFDVVPEGFEYSEEDEEDSTSARAGGTKNTQEKLDNLRAARYEKWLQSQLQDDGEWEVKSLVEKEEGDRRRESSSYSVDDRTEWFDEEESRPERKKSRPRKGSEAVRDKRVSSRSAIEALDDCDEL